MKTCVIIRYSEIFLKGNNRGFFERTFEENMVSALRGLSYTWEKQEGRYLVEDYAEEDVDEILSRLEKVFGVHTLSVAFKVSSDMDDIFSAALLVCEDEGSFKVMTHRADKKYPLTSMEISAEIGAKILDMRHNLRVDVHNPDFLINIDVRDSVTSLVFGKFIKGPGGMPVGTTGKGLLLLSGGIDSPVAGKMIAKRGMKVNCVHFHSYPYTNLQAKDKVIRLAKKLSPYTSGLTLYIVKVTKIQEEIHKKCDGDYMVALLRRFMVRIGEKLSQWCGAQCLITGESLGQVASQTIEGMTSTGDATSLQILRPLVGFDKNEIIDLAKEMETYDISIEPYEDCCTVFLPRHPVIHPALLDVLREEKKLDVDALVEEAISDVEKIEF
ncbi:MAG: tRNA 4-thiouridine(8) synthase ThiI [Clostridia bacterium]|nr:tRNA 4-thiouridine(8) synthase ThiI [Clostridia bacterium]